MGARLAPADRAELFPLLRPAPHLRSPFHQTTAKLQFRLPKLAPHPLGLKWRLPALRWKFPKKFPELKLQSRPAALKLLYLRWKSPFPR